MSSASRHDNPNTALTATPAGLTGHAEQCAGAAHVCGLDAGDEASLEFDLGEEGLELCEDGIAVGGLAVLLHGDEDLVDLVIK